MQSSITACSTGQSANQLHHRGDEGGDPVVSYNCIIFGLLLLVNKKSGSLGHDTHRWGILGSLPLTNLSHFGMTLSALFLMSTRRQ